MEGVAYPSCPKRRSVSSMPPYAYDSAACRHKHDWEHPRAGFRPDTKRGAVGKCNNTITQTIAQGLLDQAVPGLVSKNGHPEEFYAVHEGEVYVAYPTEHGKSYHGFPWRGDGNPNQFLPDEIRQILEARAQQSGHGKRFKEWMRKYHPS
jgi:hypothetical protein